MPSRSNKGNKLVHFQPNKAFLVAYKMYPLRDGCSIMQHFKGVGYYSFSGGWFMIEDPNGVCAPSLNDISDSERVVR